MANESKSNADNMEQSAAATAEARRKLAEDVAMGGTKGTRWPPDSASEMQRTTR